MSDDATWTWRLPTFAWRRHGMAYLLFAVAHAATAAIFLADRTPGTAAALNGFPLDDTWIHLVYGRALSRFEGFAYNPGQLEAGFTSPAWALLLAPTFWIARLWGGDVVPAVKALGILVAWLASVGAYRVALRLTGRRVAAYAAGLVVALDPAFAFAKVSGMEVAMVAAALLYVSWSLAEGKLLGAALGIALAPVVRPEALVACVPAGLALASGLAARRSTWGWILAELPVLVTMGLWVAFCVAVTGHPLPNTYYVKHQPAAEHFFPNLGRIVEILGTLPWAYSGAGLVLLVVGAWVILRSATRSDDRAVRLSVVAMPFAFLLAIAWAHDLKVASGFYWYRYLYPAIPLLAVPLGAGIAVAIQALRAITPMTAGRVVTAAGAAVVLVLAFVRWPDRTLAMAHLFAANCENIEEMNVKLGRWVGEHAPRDRWIAVGDAGALRFFSDRPTVDLLGLNSRQVLFEGPQQALDATNPAYYVVFPGVFQPLLSRNPRFRAVQTVRAKRYTICSCPGQQEMVVFAAEPASPYALDMRARDAIEAVLRTGPPGSRAWIAVDAVDPQARALADDLAATFARAGWRVGMELATFRVRAGILLLAGDDEPPPSVDIVRRALESVGLPVMFGSGYRAYAERLKQTIPDWNGAQFRPGQAFLVVVGRPR